MSETVTRALPLASSTVAGKLKIDQDGQDTAASTATTGVLATSLATETANRQGADNAESAARQAGDMSSLLLTYLTF